MSKTKLSDRVRPNSEAAPWVIDEIKLLEAKIERMNAALNSIAFSKMKAWGDRFQDGLNFQADIARKALFGDEA